MPTDIKPLFRPEALRPALAGFPFPDVPEARKKLKHWAALLASPKANQLKETELLADFLTDTFLNLLGYTGPASGSDNYSLKREANIEVDGKFADAVLGRFSTVGEKPQFALAIEGKGPRDPLDRPFAGRKRSAVEQALQYAVQLQIDWYMVTNLKELRLYHKGHDTLTYERFETETLAKDDNELRRFVYLLGAERLLAPAGNHLNTLLAESKKIGRQLTNEYYLEYRNLRAHTFNALRTHNADRDPAALLAATQKILDRILFIAFCEDRHLMPRDIIDTAYRQTNKFTKRPIWENFVGLFRAVDEGSDDLNIAHYNGGLFARDEFLESLVVPNEICEEFRKLAEYGYGNDPEGEGKLIDVEILGHIFEQSISDLEEMQDAIAGRVKETRAKEQKRTTRKESGAFYTPAFITRYIVAETLGPVVAERFEKLRAAHEVKATKPLRRFLADPAAFDPDRVTKTQSAALVSFWNAWIDELGTIRIVDPACGSGAFLIETFDQLFAEYRKAQGYLEALQGKTLFDIRKAILERNLFGVDLNGEAVEIARLSCWIKTAELGKVLTSLDHNIREGNSVIADPAVHPKAFDWRAAFPEVFAAGGFDVVVGNPPYVRQEWISQYKPYLQGHFRAYDGAADLYVYFYELALNLLKPGGRLGYVVTNKWMKAGYGEPLRRLFAECAWVESVVDFGHAKQIFPDADVFPSVLVIRKPTHVAAPNWARVCAIPREQLRVDDLSRQISVEGFSIPRGQLVADQWNLEPPAVTELLEKIGRAGVTLREFARSAPVYGIKTGFNEAFLIDTELKDRLLSADPSSASLFRPFLRGQDIRRWHAEWSGQWMIAIRSSANSDWPWSNKGDSAEKTFSDTFPAIYAHFRQYRDELCNRGNQGRYWWELPGLSNWDLYEQPKIMYQEIQFHPSYMLDRAGLLANNKVFFLPTDDQYLLAILNSPLMWWHNWRFLPHMKDEALTPAGFRMECLPIAEGTAKTRDEIAHAVVRLIEITKQRLADARTMLDWLRVEFDIEKPSQKLQNVGVLDADLLIAEVKKARGKTKTLTAAGVKALKDEHGRTVVPLQTLAAEATRLEHEVSDLVNAAYGLTPDEVELMWKTAPPRMPISR